MRWSSARRRPAATRCISAPHVACSISTTRSVRSAWTRRFADARERLRGECQKVRRARARSRRTRRSSPRARSAARAHASLGRRGMNAASGPDLRDIHLPPTPSWWPPAPGWWLLAIVVLIAIATGVVDAAAAVARATLASSRRRRARSHRGAACGATERRAPRRRRLAAAAPRRAPDRTGRGRAARRGVARVPRQPIRPGILAQRATNRAFARTPAAR